jgi:hypothetical protein
LGNETKKNLDQFIDKSTTINDQVLSNSNQINSPVKTPITTSRSEVGNEKNETTEAQNSNIYKRNTKILNPTKKQSESTSLNTSSTNVAVTQNKTPSKNKQTNTYISNSKKTKTYNLDNKETMNKFVTSTSSKDLKSTKKSLISSNKFLKKSITKKDLSKSSISLDESQDMKDVSHTRSMIQEGEKFKNIENIENTENFKNLENLENFDYVTLTENKIEEKIEDENVQSDREQQIEDNLSSKDRNSKFELPYIPNDINSKNAHKTENDGKNPEDLSNPSATIASNFVNACLDNLYRRVPVKEKRQSSQSLNTNEIPNISNKNLNLENVLDNKSNYPEKKTNVNSGNEIFNIKQETNFAPIIKNNMITTNQDNMGISNNHFSISSQRPLRLKEVKERDYYQLKINLENSISIENLKQSKTFENLIQSGGSFLIRSTQLQVEKQKNIPSDFPNNNLKIDNDTDFSISSSYKKYKGFNKNQLDSGIKISIPHTTRPKLNSFKKSEIQLLPALDNSKLKFENLETSSLRVHIAPSFARRRMDSRLFRISKSCENSNISRIFMLSKKLKSLIKKKIDKTPTHSHNTLPIDIKSETDTHIQDKEDLSEARSKKKKDVLIQPANIRPESDKFFSENEISTIINNIKSKSKNEETSHNLKEIGLIKNMKKINEKESRSRSRSPELVKVRADDVSRSVSPQNFESKFKKKVDELRNRLQETQPRENANININKIRINNIYTLNDERRGNFYPTAENDLEKFIENEILIELKGKSDLLDKDRLVLFYKKYLKKDVQGNEIFPRENLGSRMQNNTILIKKEEAENRQKTQKIKELLNIDDKEKNNKINKTTSSSFGRDRSPVQDIKKRFFITTETQNFGVMPTNQIHSTKNRSTLK